MYHKVNERNEKFILPMATAKGEILPLYYCTEDGNKVDAVINTLTRDIVVEVNTVYIDGFDNGVVVSSQKASNTSRNKFTIYTLINSAFSNCVGIAATLAFNNADIPPLQGYISELDVYINHPLQDEMKIVFVGYPVQSETTLQNKIEKEENNNKIIRKINRRFTF